MNEDRDIPMVDSGLRKPKLADLLRAEDLDNSSACQYFSSTASQKKEIADALSGDVLCVECEDQKAVVVCIECNEYFCQVCCFSIHRKGNRQRHTLVKRTENQLENVAAKDVLHVSVTGTALPMADEPQKASDADLRDSFISLNSKLGELTDGSGTQKPSIPDGEILGAEEIMANVSDLAVLNEDEILTEQAKYIPVRLSINERKYLRLLDAALSVSEYTDHVDVISYLNKPRRIVHQIKELCQILSGLLLAADYRAGQELFEDKSFEQNTHFYQSIFELGRRHKIMNPEKMRSTYGKLVYVLQDSQIYQVRDMLNFKCVKPIKTVYAVLEKNDCLPMLKEPLANVATMEIDSTRKSRHQIQKEIKMKEQAIEHLVRKYTKTTNANSEKLRQCLYSIGDNRSYIRANRDPCLKVISYLRHYFDPQKPEAGYSLSISTGSGGARLSHNHGKQYQFVLQSLTLWSLILNDMFRLWYLAEQDLLDEGNEYRLRDTGQGLNRVQACPRTSRAMHTILAHAQSKLGNWVGSSVVHLGDSNVPNALLFIDKYSQISRILSPLCQCIERIPEIMQNKGLATYIQSSFTSSEALIKEILCDFFRHAFDGSGADNYFDAGSCIDGRLTSAWNWCSQIEKKRYYPVFMLTGFFGFDGKFE